MFIVEQHEIDVLTLLNPFTPIFEWYMVGGKA